MLRIVLCLLGLALAGHASRLYAQLDPSPSNREQQLAIIREALRAGDRENLFQAAYFYIQLDSLERSRQILARVIHAPDGTEIVDSLTGLAWHTIGMTRYLREEDELAIEPYQNAIRVRDAVFDGPHIHRAHSRYNLAFSYRWASQPAAAISTLREALDLYREMEVKDTTNWIRSLRLTTILAQEHYDARLQRAAAIGLTDLLDAYRRVESRDLVQGREAAARSFLNLHEYDLALVQAERGIEEAIDLGFYQMAADLLNVKANILNLAGFRERAQETYLGSIDLLKRIQGDPTSINIAYFNLADLHLQAGLPEVAQVHLDSAKNYPFNDDPSAPLIFLKLTAEIAEQRGDTLAAMAAVNQAAAIINGQAVEPGRLGTINVYPDSVNQNEEIADVHFLRARYLAKRGDYLAAKEDVDQAIKFRELQRAGVASDANRYVLSEKVYKTYDLGIAVHRAAYLATGEEADLWRAFDYSERSRAYSLRARLAEREQGADARLQELRFHIAQLERQLSPDRAHARQLADLQVELELLLRTRRSAENPEQTFSRADYQRWLAEEGAALLEYHVGAKTSVGFLLSASGELQTWDLPPATELRGLVEDYRRALFATRYEGESLLPASEREKLDSTFTEAAARLRAAVLPEKSLGGQRLYWSPDASLNFLPFAALLPPGTVLQRIPSGRYLLQLSRRKQPEYDLGLLGFAPSYGGESSPKQYAANLRGGAAGRAMTGRGGVLPALSPLLNNILEVREAAERFADAKIFTGEAATRRAFVNSLNRLPAVLHISGHGYFQPDAPRFSWLAFTQPRDSVRLDELLYFNDLTALPLQSDLVVLSACETSLGGVVPGEAVTSLGNAFLAAGARSTLTSLWRVDDEATRALMRVFYAELHAGRPREEALHTAQKTLADGGRYAHPYYWSGFVLSGQGGPVRTSESAAWPGWWYVLLAAGAIALAALAWLVWWRRK